MHLPSSSCRLALGLSAPQGFAGLVDAVAAWVQLVTQQLEDLGPVPMHNFTYKTVQDEMVIYEER